MRGRRAPAARSLASCRDFRAEGQRHSARTERAAAGPVQATRGRSRSNPHWRPALRNRRQDLRAARATTRNVTTTTPSRLGNVPTIRRPINIKADGFLWRHGASQVRCVWWIRLVAFEAGCVPSKELRRNGPGAVGEAHALSLSAEVGPAPNYRAAPNAHGSRENCRRQFAKGLFSNRSCRGSATHDSFPVGRPINASPIGISAAQATLYRGRLALRLRATYGSGPLSEAEPAASTSE